MADTDLPPLPLEEWKATKDTLHLWAQIIGKTRLAIMPMRNHWWNATLYPSARGLTTRRMPVDTHNLELELDLIEHRVSARTSDSDASFALYDGLSVADFHERFNDMLDRLDVRVDIKAEPFGVSMTTPFPDDHDHASYDTDAVARFLRVLQWSADVLEEFAGWYCGKSTPVHVFWHGFDLATSRFSGVRAPARSGVDAVTAEAYSHEVISFGFWAGDKNNPLPAYYSYTARTRGAPDHGPSARHGLVDRASEWLARDPPLRRRQERSRPEGDVARLLSKRLRSRGIPRRLGSRRHRHAVVPCAVRSAHRPIATGRNSQEGKHHMNIATAGRGNIGSGLAALWTAAGHNVKILGATDVTPATQTSSSSPSRALPSPMRVAGVSRERATAG